MKRFFPLFTVLLFAAANLHAQEWAKAKLEKSPRHPEWVKIKHDAREVNCFVVYPEVKDKTTAIVLIHEIFGLTDWAREMADELAAEGYIVIAPDLLSGSVTNGGGTEELVKSGGNVGKAIQALPPAQITDDLAAAVDYAAKLPSCNGKVVVGGFCWGGGQSFRFAANNQDVKAAFVFYGTPPNAERHGAHQLPGLWLLRRQRRARDGDGSESDRTNESCWQNLRAGDLRRRGPRLHARGRSAGCECRKQKSPR